MIARGGRWPAAALVLAASVLAVAPTASAAAAPSLPENFSAADQYVESVPAGGGPSAPGVGKETNAPLPPGISGRLTGKTGATLKQVATSSKLGAPNRRLPHVRVDSPSVPSAAVSALDEGEGGRLIWLLLALLLVTGVVAGTAGHRHYHQRKAAGGS